MILRETSSRERSMYFQGTRYPVNFSFRLKLSGKLDISRMEQSLLECQRVYPQFGSRYEITPEKKQYLRNDEVAAIPFRTTTSTSDWDILMASEVALPFESHKYPPVRFLYREETGDLIATFHHAACDGLSGVLFLDTLFRFYGEPDFDPRPQPVNPILIDLMKEEDLADFRNREKPEWLKTREVNCTPSEPVPYDERQFAITPFQLSRSMTQQLRDKAREEKTTVHAALAAAFLHGFDKVVGNGEETRTIQSPINFRPFLKPEAADYPGCFIGIIKAETELRPEKGFWELAREIRSKFQEELKSNDQLFLYYTYMTHGLTGVEDPEAMFANRPAWPMDYDASLSNLGPVDLQTGYGDIGIEELYGPTFSAVNGERVIGLNTFNGSVRFTFIHEKKHFKAEDARNIAKTAIMLLEQEVSGGNK